MPTCSDCFEEFPEQAMFSISRTSAFGGILYTTKICGACKKGEANLKPHSGITNTKPVHNDTESTKNSQTNPLNPEATPPSILNISKQENLSGSATNRILTLLGTKLEEHCRLLCLAYPQQLDVLMRAGVKYFDIQDCSARAKNVLKVALKERGLAHEAIEELADEGFFEIRNLLKQRNAGIKTVVEIIEHSLGLNANRLATSSNTSKIIKRRSSGENSRGFSGQDQSEISRKKETIRIKRAITRLSKTKSLKSGVRYLSKLPTRTQIDLKKRCQQLNLSWPDDLDIIMTLGVHFFKIDACSVRARNVLERAFDDLSLDYWEVEELADSGFFTIQNLFSQRNLGEKTVNELIRVSLRLGSKDNFHLRNGTTEFYNQNITPHSEYVLKLIEHLYKKHDEDTFTASPEAIVYGVQSHYWSLNEIYRHTYGALNEPVICEFLVSALESKSSTLPSGQLDRFTISLIHEISRTLYNADSNELTDGLRISSRLKWTIPKKRRDFHILLHARAGIELADIGRTFDLTRERIRQISETEKRKFRNSKNYSTARKIVETAMKHQILDRNVRVFLASLYNIEDQQNLKNKTEELKQLKQQLKDNPLKTKSSLEQVIAELSLQENLDSPEVFELLKVSIRRGNVERLSKFISASIGAVAKSDISIEFPNISEDQIEDYLNDLRRKRSIVCLGKKGLYLCKSKTNLTSKQLTAGGFVLLLISQQPQKVWSFKDILDLYALETGTVPNYNAFRGSVEISKDFKRANIKIFFGRFLIDSVLNSEMAAQFDACNHPKIRSNCRHLNWDKMQGDHIPQVAFNLAQKLGESEEILEIYIQDIFSEKQREMRVTSFQSETNQSILSDLEKIAQNSPMHPNPLSVIHSFLEERNEKHDFQACSDVLFQLREKQLWLE